MPPPINTTYLTAIDITTVPLITTQDARNSDTGIVYDLWYKFTAPDNYVYGMFYYGDFDDYFAECEVYILVLGVLTSYLGLGSNNRDDRPVYFPVIVAETYYIKAKNDSGNPPEAILNISFKRAPEALIITGDIFITDEIEGFPPAVIDPLTGLVKAYAYNLKDNPSVSGDILTSGIFLVDDRTVKDYVLFDAQFNLLTRVALTWAGSFPCIRACRPGNCFYVANRIAVTPAPGDFPIVKKISNAGAIVDTWTLPDFGLDAIAVNAAETIMYNAGQGVAHLALNVPVKRWDLVNDVMLSDLVAGVANYFTASILVLADDTILVLYGEISGTNDAFVRHYSTAGATLHTYPLGETNVVGFTSNYLFQALDDPLSFWVRHHPRVGSEFNMSAHTNIRISDGTVLASVNTPEFTAGVMTRFSEEAASEQFGDAPSCPAFLLQADAEPPTTGTITIIKTTVPSSDPAVFQFTADGMDPVTFELAHGESRTFSGLIPGTYGVTEVEVAGYTIVYSISNSDEHDAITIEAGDEIIVTVTNTALNPETSYAGIYKIQPGKRNDSLWTSTEAQTVTDVKIPNPVAKSSFFGG